MLSLNKTLHYIEAAEPDVVAIYRSVNTVVISPEDHKQQPCDAFLCVVRENGKQSTYAALSLTADRKTLVYSPDPSSHPESTSDNIGHALSFLEAMGFRMENLDLNYSTALREVIVRGISVLRPPKVRGGEPAEQVAVTAAAAENLAKLQAEWEVVLRERGAADRAERERLAEEHARIAGAAAAELAELRAELARLRPDSDFREQAMADELAAVKAELELLKEDYELLRTEYSLINEELTARNADLQQVNSEKAAAEKAAAEEIATLKAAAAARPAVEKEPAAPLAPISSPGTSSPAQEATPGVDGPNHFNLDHSLTAIPCRSNDDVVELHMSFNTISITPADHNSQNCSSYICGLEQEGATHIYIALYLNEDKKALVYVPEKQPADAAAYGRVMRDAICFAETAGFMMELLPLGSDPAGRAKALKGIPVLGGTSG